MLSLYDVDIILRSELILSGSEYPKGPYIGLPSYAQPIIGEWSVIWLNSPFELIVKLFSNVLATVWEYPKIPKLKEFSLEVKLKSPNLCVLFNVKLLTLAPNDALDPLGIISTSVERLL